MLSYSDIKKEINNILNELKTEENEEEISKLINEHNNIYNQIKNLRENPEEANFETIYNQLESFMCRFDFLSENEKEIVLRLLEEYANKINNIEKILENEKNEANNIIEYKEKIEESLPIKNKTQNTHEYDNIR